MNVVIHSPRVVHSNANFHRLWQRSYSRVCSLGPLGRGFPFSTQSRPVGKIAHAIERITAWRQHTIPRFRDKKAFVKAMLQETLATLLVCGEGHTAELTFRYSVNISV